MTGRSYKQVKKDDKNKKKLKTALKNVATKTKLPKGQNLTDINQFKVKKIVIKDQVKPHEPGELLYRKKLNINELAARLNHHNTSVKFEALDGLKELTTNYPAEILGSHHLQVLEAVVKLCLDETSSIRKAAIKVMGTILSLLPRNKLSPFFGSLHSYLTCGLTHIDKGIREDGIALMDVCLKQLPDLCEKYAYNLLGVCLDLISNKMVGSRTLTLNLDSSVASTKWRCKVLERIHSLLCAVYSGTNEADSRSNTNDTMHFKIGEVNHFPVYSKYSCAIFDISISSESKSSAIDFADGIIPLLMGMFLEISPTEKAQSASELSTFINEETFKLLTLIVDIINTLYDIIDRSEQRNKFDRLSKKLSRSILQTLISKKFPYSMNNKIDKNAVETSSVALNLSIARMVLIYTEQQHWNTVVPFLKNCFRIADRLSSDEISTFADCSSKIILENHCDDSVYFLKKAIEMSRQNQTQLSSHFFKLLGSIALNPRYVSFHEIPDFQNWLQRLPERMCNPKLTLIQADIISKIAVRHFSGFLRELNVQIEFILDNIPKIETVDDNKKEIVQRQMATMLYWVSDWDEELVASLKPAIDNCYWGERLTKYIGEIVSMKAENVCIA